MRHIVSSRKRHEDISYFVEILKVSLVQAASQLVRDDTFHHDVNAEGVESFADELLA
jgi:hypothetical protein